MKNCNEMVNSLLERREQYETEKKNRRKMLTRTITPLCCMCLVALFGFGAWQNGLLEKQPMQTAEDAVVPGTKDWYGPGEEELSQNTDNTNSIDPQIESDNISDQETKEVVSSFGEGKYSASYATPENGKFYFSVPLNGAIDEYGNDVVYHVVIDVFCEKEQLLKDDEQIDTEIKRLSDNGYDLCKENINGTAYIVMTAELNQLSEFSANENYGYFMFLYSERIDGTE